jgi:hypothetical protein
MSNLTFPVGCGMPAVKDTIQRYRHVDTALESL